MNKKIFLNILMNFVFLVFFIILNNWALQKSLEETFISLALIYGVAVVLGNAVFISAFFKE